jgi:NodT family efflux transporter outer membrane factor (OMF) lipoprotein
MKHLVIDVASLTAVLLLSLSALGADRVDVKKTPLWEHFNDPVLTELVEKGLANNPGISAAKARIEMAEAQAEVALAPLHPSITAEGSYAVRSFNTRSIGLDLSSMPGASEPPNYSQSLGAYLKAQYLVDITGRHYRQRQASLKEAAASADDADSIAMMLATQIVQTYYDVVSAKMRTALIEKQVENDQKLLDLIMIQFRAGQVSSLDVLQQRQKLKGMRSQLPLVHSFIEISKQQLATLIGEDNPENLPVLPDDLPVFGGAPGESSADGLLDAKPELRAAQTRIEAAEDQIRSTRRALLPTLALSAQVGYDMTRLTENRHGEQWSVGALLSVPLYQKGSLAALGQIRAAKRSAEFTLEDNLLKARAQVANSRKAEEEQAKYLAALNTQVADAEQLVKEATKRYMAGLSPYLNVLTANAAYQGNQLSIIQARRDLVSARINLLSAFGGDWTRNLVKD